MCIFFIHNTGKYVFLREKVGLSTKLSTWVLDYPHFLKLHMSQILRLNLFWTCSALWIKRFDFQIFSNKIILFFPYSSSYWEIYCKRAVIFDKFLRHSGIQNNPLKQIKSLFYAQYLFFVKKQLQIFHKNSPFGLLVIIWYRNFNRKYFIL